VRSVSDFLPIVLAVELRRSGECELRNSGGVRRFGRGMGMGKLG
jgi:hypothetical protein